MSLDELRSELEAVDREILALVARRRELAAAIGQTKRDAGVPTRDYRREQVVIQRARAEAEALGISPELAETLMLLLIRSSLTVQERDRVAARAAGTGQRALIIGGSGKMGSWFARFLGSQGYAIELADPAPPAADLADCPRIDDFRASALDHDVIVVAVSMAATNDILHALAERRPPGLVFDLGSLKTPLRTGLKALIDAGVRATSLHPMFGPDANLLSGRHVIFIDLGHAEALATARALFSATMATQVDMDLDRHDRLIAYVLGLSHALNIAFFTALAESGESAPALARMSSTTFDAQLDVAARVASESPALYFEIQALNDYGRESLAALLYAVERIRSVILAGDQAGFAAIMGRGAEYLRERSAQQR
ncbi:MAG: bifunctional chorismate mutase/prephenate dehydrogenase [Haliangiales bacterium]